MIDRRRPAAGAGATFDALAADAALPPGDGISTRILLQQRLEGGDGRIVERLTLRSDRHVIVKARNDRPLDREALLYQHLLPRAGDLIPAYLGSATIDGMHGLALEDVAGRPCNPVAPSDRERAIEALARFQRCFPGGTVSAILGPNPAPELIAEVTPDPIEQPELLTAYRGALSRLAAVLPAPLYRQAEERSARVAAAIAASPLVLDPGDVRLENVLLGAETTVLLDFENAAIRRSGLALVAMLEHWPDPDDLLRRYLAHSGKPPNVVVPAVRAGRLWLALRDVATGVASGTPVSPELIQRLLLWLRR